MSIDFAARPAAGEFGDFHAGYIAAVPPGDIRETLAREAAAAASFYSAISEERAGFAYAPGKWTVREVLAHIADGERVFACGPGMPSRNPSTVRSRSMCTRRSTATRRPEPGGCVWPDWA